MSIQLRRTRRGTFAVERIEDRVFLSVSFGGETFDASRVSGPTDVVSADFNGDGLLDAAVTTSGLSNDPGTIDLFRNVGNGQFVREPSITTAASPKHLIAADFSGDGIPDLAVTCFFGGRVQAFISNGQFGFSQSGSLATANPLSLADGDIDHDGDQDVVVLTNGGALLYWMNAGHGTFTLRNDIALAGALPATVQLADVDGDTDLDVLTCNRGDSNVSVLTNNGAGVFGNRVDYGTGANPSDLVVADLNGDSKLDFAVCAQNAPSSFIYRFLNNGSGGFTGPVYVTSIPNATCLRAADLDRDGDIDLTVSSTELTNNVLSMMNNGSATFTQVGRYTAGGAFAHVCADITGDGLPDLLSANYSSGGLAINSGMGDGSFVSSTQYAVSGTNIRQTITADIDGDTDLDIVSANESTGNVDILKNDGQGQFGSLQSLPAPGPAWGVAAIDLGGDGDLDILSAHPSPTFPVQTGTNILYLNERVGNSFAPATVLFQFPYVATLKTGDVDHDGDVDLLGALPGTLLVCVNNGGTLAPPMGFATGIDLLGDSTDIQLADLDGDLDLDVMLANTTSGTVGVLKHVQQGNYAAVQTYPAVGAYQTATADLDRDGDLDLVAINANAPTMAVLRNDGTGAFSTWYTVITENATLGVASADFDGDGHADIVTADAATVSIWAARPDGTLAPRRRFASGPTARLVVARLNGDGKPDLVSESLGNGEVMVDLAMRDISLPTWSTAGSVAAWNQFEKRLTVTGAASITAEPGSDQPKVTVTGPSGSMSISPATGRAVHLAGLSVSNGAAATVKSLNTGPTAANRRVLIVNSLTIDATSKLDLTDNDLIIDYTTASPLGSFSGGSYSGITGLLASGRNGGAWNGGGLMTSYANANLYALAVAEASRVLSASGGTFAGQSVDGTTVLVKFTYAGDANLDGKINVDDYTRIDFNVALGTSGWYNGDFNYDGKINVDDYTIIDFNVGIQGPPISSSAGADALMADAGTGGELVSRPALYWGSQGSWRADRAADWLIENTPAIA